MEPAGSIVPVSLLMATVIPFSPSSAEGSAVTQPLRAPVQTKVSVSNAAVSFFFMSYLLMFVSPACFMEIFLSYIWEVIL